MVDWWSLMNSCLFAAPFKHKMMRCTYRRCEAIISVLHVRCFRLRSLVKVTPKFFSDFTLVKPFLETFGPERIDDYVKKT